MREKLVLGLSGGVDSAVAARLLMEQYDVTCLWLDIGLGGGEDAQAVEAGMFSGAVMIATVHAGSREELIRRPVCRRMLDTGAFGYVALLYGRRQPGKIAGLYKAGDLLGQDHGTASAGSGLCRYRAGGVA